MIRSATRSIGRALAAIAALSAWVESAVSGEDLRWEPMPGGRSAALAVPSAGKTGFTLLPPAQTGVWFTNTLEEWQGASNRVLFNGSGVAAGDYDRDGWPDLFICGLNTPNQLYRNLGGWRFKEVTAEAGVVCPGKFYRGAVFADVNGDGTLDLLVATTGQGVLCFQNDGSGKFTDVTRAARTGSAHGSVSLALADVDGNGTLDLYVANNRTEDMRDRGQVDLQLVNGQMTVPPALKDRLVVSNGQVLEYGEPDQLLLNDGQGRFAPVSWTGGRFRTEQGGPLTEPPRDWGLTATFRDINDDGVPDLYVCNDFWTPDRLWLNDGKGRFRAAPPLALRNTSASSMGIDFADIDRDGDMDFFVLDMLSRDPRLRKRQKLAQAPYPSPIGAFDDRPQIMRNTLFLNRGDGTFAELAHYTGLAASEWSWSAVFLDVDLDGYEDLLITSGHAKDVQDLDAAAQIRARQRSRKGFTNEVARQKAFTQELMEHMRLYPALDTPIIAFRNRGDLRFEEVTSTWGTDQSGVHHAMALADLDRDGDLDVAVNNLDSPAGVYRNETAAARVAVRLAGLSPNVQGIGAKVRLLGGAVPMQSQEVICGGRYMAGSEPMLVFACGSKSNAMILEVTWRNGRSTVVSNVLANRVYEIEEKSVVSGQSSAAPTSQAPLAATNASTLQPFNPSTLFVDASHLLRHTHHEDPFDDFERQPLLPRRLSQLGPGVSWFDVNRDGFEDLIIASGKGGPLVCYRNDGAGSFQRLAGAPLDTHVTRDQTAVLGWWGPDGAVRLLAGSANYEDGLAAGSAVRQFDLGRKGIDDSFPGDTASTGPLALADVDGDADLDLFVGGRVVPGRYPEPASSRLYRFDGAKFQLDSANSKILENAGLVSGAVWSDLDGDALPELILACEWGPLKIYGNNQGQLTLWDAPVKWLGAPLTPHSSLLTLLQLTGWWNGVTTGDLDGDGRMDIIAANWGLNSEYTATPVRPLPLSYGDLLERGTVDLLEAEWDPAKKDFAPRRRLDVMSRYFPQLVERFGSHRRFSEASMTEVLGPNGSRARRVEATVLSSMLFLNRGDHFEAALLPSEAQWAPAWAVNVADFDGDGQEDVFLSQNFFATQPEMPRLDAGRGLLLRGTAGGMLEAVPGQRSGIEVYGEQRGAAVGDYDGDGRVDLVVSQNGGATKLFHNRGAQPGLRIRLIGPPANPGGVGVWLRLKFGPRLGPVREIHAGSGYWSQDGAIQVLALPGRATHLLMRWPGASETSLELPLAATQITVSHSGKVTQP